MLGKRMGLSPVLVYSRRISIVNSYMTTLVFPLLITCVTGNFYRVSYYA